MYLSFIILCALREVFFFFLTASFDYLFLILNTYIHSTSWEIPGWMTHRMTPRNQDYWEKYQQPQICR